MQHITTQETELERHHQNPSWCSGGEERILSSLGFRGCEIITQRAEEKARVTASLRHCGSRLLNSRRGRAWGGGGRKKKRNKRTKEMPQNLAEQDLEQTPWECNIGVWYPENKSQAFFPPPKQHPPFLVRFFPYGEKAQAGGQGRGETTNGKSCASFFESWALPVNWSYFHE